MTQAQPANAPASKLPSPPPSVKRSTPWDKEHLSETLAGISQAFASSQNFGEGLGAAAGSIGDRMKVIRAEDTKSVTLGGPDNSFEVMTDPRTGQRTYRPIEAFQSYAAEKYRREHAPSAKESAEQGAVAMDAVLILPPEQQAAAAAAAKARLKAQGYDVGHLPDAENYSVQAATFARDLGIDPMARRKADRVDEQDEERRQYQQDMLDIRREMLGLSKTREARAALPKAPPKAARAKLPAGFILD